MLRNILALTTDSLIYFASRGLQLIFDYYETRLSSIEISLEKVSN